MVRVSGVTILHIDDNEMNRYVVTRMLHAEGFQVIEAETGELGLQLAIEKDPDLVILDVKLPGLSGFEVCKHLKSNPDTAFIPVLHLSATFVASQDKAHGLDSGADAYLAQPVEAIELIATVRALLRIRRAEEAALTLAREWQTTFDSISDGVGLLDEKGYFLRCNQALIALLHKPVSEIIGFSHSAIAPDITDAVNETPFSRAQTLKQRQSEEVQWGERWFLLTVDPIVNPLQQFAGAVYILADITERKRVEQERTLLLAREQEARAQAEAANRLKDEFLATLSHELRSPLNAMLGWTRLLNTRKFDEQRTAQAMQTIERSARAQAQLVEDLLDVSRIIQGKLRLNIRPVQLAEAIAAAIETIRPAAEAKQIEIQTAFEDPVGEVAGDFDRLQQIVWNLLSNAIKFTPKQGQVRVELQSVNSHIELNVSDTGQGIKADFLPYVFDRFRQADSSITRSYSGLGLGLAIVRHLVELHGGTVGASSAGEDRGATFTLKFPLMSASVETPAIPRISTPTINPALDGNLPCLQGIRVLVVDDEVDTRDYLGFVLEQCQAEVWVAASAQDAIAALGQFKPNVLVSDIGMPQEDGYTFIRKVRALSKEQGGEIPAIALTAYARTEDRKQAIASGFQLHLSKPIEPKELAVGVASLLGKV
ncbi:MAG: response regulator [Desertifilum sp.]|nr:response regulator [Desertifilum sp.]